MKVTKYCAPTRNDVFINLHTSIYITSKSFEALVASYLGKDVCLQCKLHTHDAMTLFSSSCHHHFIQLFKTCHIEVAKSLVPNHDSFIQRLCHIHFFLSNIDVEKILVFSLHVSTMMALLTLFTSQPSLSNSTFKP